LRAMEKWEFCEMWVKGVAERESSMTPDSKTTQGCKFGDPRQIDELVRGGRFLYGNQFDRTPVCYTADMNGKVQKKRSLLLLVHCQG
jgi:hypothetical protein